MSVIRLTTYPVRLAAPWGNRSNELLSVGGPSFILGVILSGAVFQAERRISRESKVWEGHSGFGKGGLAQVCFP